MDGDLDFGTDDIMALLQAMGGDCGPLPTRVNQEVVIFTQSFHCLPWERADDTASSDVI